LAIDLARLVPGTWLYAVIPAQAEIKVYAVIPAQAGI